MTAPEEQKFDSPRSSPLLIQWHKSKWIELLLLCVCVLIFIACPAAALAHSTAIKSVNIRPWRETAGGRATLRLKLIAAIYFHNANISNSRFTRVESVALVPPTGGQSAGASTLKELQPRGAEFRLSDTHLH